MFFYYEGRAYPSVAPNGAPLNVEPSPAKIRKKKLARDEVLGKLRLVYTADFRGLFRINSAHSWEQKLFGFLKTRAGLIRNWTHV